MPSEMTIGRNLFAASLAAFGMLALPATATAAVEVIQGATPIPDGEATAPGDITIRNDRVAFAIAVESAAPWGVPRGAIVDLAAVRNGKIALDRVAFADFIPNNWSAWPSTYQRVEIIRNTPEEAVVKAERDWEKVKIETVYTLKAGEDRVHLVTTMTNAGDKPYTDILSGFTLWPDSGYLFGVPGLEGMKKGSADNALADRVVAYDEDWSIALHAPYFDQINYDSKDMYRSHSLQPGESRRFEGWLQVGASGDLAPVTAAEIARKGLPAGTVTGKVATKDGTAVENPVVVVEKDGHPYTWALGSDGAYSLALPEGAYTLYATAKGHSQSARADIRVGAGKTGTKDFADLEAPGRLRFTITERGSGRPLDARIAIAEGERPLVEFLGKKTFFTELEPAGQAEITIAPGDYVFTIGSGEGFLSKSKPVPVKVEPQTLKPVDAAIDIPFDPNEAGWYAADMHHHADQLEGVTPPEYVARSELAAGLDLLFVSDHDSTVNHKEMQELADRRGVPFIPSVELSPSWGHFNPYPLALGEPLAIDPGTSSVQDVLAEARRLGADAVQANHPYIPYGYFQSLDEDVAPGGFDPRFELLEINSSNAEDDEKLLKKLWKLWNGGHRYYLSAGSDTHDVWNDLSGEVRAYAHVTGKPTPRSFVAALKEGHAFVTYGPLVFPDRMFGDELKVKPGETFELGFTLQAVNGLKKATLISRGEEVETSELSPDRTEARVTFPVTADSDGWYALVVEDAKGKRAYTNPIWIDAISYEKTAAAK